jgi:outer membrane lipoprotein carrier protein
MAVVKYSYLIGISLFSSLCFLAPALTAADNNAAAASGNSVAVANMQKTPGQELLELLLNLDNTQANFEQALLNFQGQVVDQSTGTLTLSKPSLRWQVDLPFAQIIVVADGLLRIFDPDLEQVIEKDMAGSEVAPPLKLLLDPSQLLGGDYLINIIEVNGEAQFLLQPTSNQSLFMYVRLAFDGPQLSQLEITDHVGQRTRVTFSQVRSGEKIPASAFELVLPENTDVVRG